MRKRIVKPSKEKSLRASSDLVEKEVQVTKKTDFRTKKKKPDAVKTELSDKQGELIEKESLCGTKSTS